MTPIDTQGIPECIECGACCFSPVAHYIRLWAVDLERMGPFREKFSEPVGGAVYLRMSEGHCAALMLDSKERTFKCAMYEVRPDACRVFERGGGQCRSDRSEKRGRAEDALLKLGKGRS